jgi:hypothetical protein
LIIPHEEEFLLKKVERQGAARHFLQLLKKTPPIGPLPRVDPVLVFHSEGISQVRAGPDANKGGDKNAG